MNMEIDGKGKRLTFKILFLPLSLLDSHITDLSLYVFMCVSLYLPNKPSSLYFQYNVQICIYPKGEVGLALGYLYQKGVRLPSPFKLPLPEGC